MIYFYFDLFSTMDSMMSESEGESLSEHNFYTSSSERSQSRIIPSIPLSVGHHRSHHSKKRYEKETKTETYEIGIFSNCLEF